MLFKAEENWELLQDSRFNLKVIMQHKIVKLNHSSSPFILLMKIKSCHNEWIDV